MTGPKWLYLHGFASGPESGKGRATRDHFAARGVTVERLDLRVPSFEHLRFSAMMDTTIAAIGGARDRAILFGSSFGGLTAARVAERDPRVCALVLLAPAFRMAERWRARMKAEEWDAWRATGWLEVDDYARGGKSRIDFAFIEELDRLDQGWPDVRVPTLIVHGTQDDVVDPALSATWAADKPWVRRIEVPDGHELGASIFVIQKEAEKFLCNFMR